MSSFSIDAYEVTVGRFRRYWTSGGAAPTFPTTGTHVPYPSGDMIWDASWVPQMPLTGTYNTWVSGPDNHPINSVDWYTAQAFCIWDGGRLPTQAEWEFAARGTTGRIYPWGNTAPTSTGPACSGLLSPAPTGTCPVGRFSPSGDTPNGIHDLAGGVGEWNADNYNTYGPAGCPMSGQQNPLGNTSATGDRVIRGGSWHDYDAGYFRAASREDARPVARSIYVGFRCVRTP